MRIAETVVLATSTAMALFAGSYSIGLGFTEGIYMAAFGIVVATAAIARGFLVEPKHAYLLLQSVVVIASQSLMFIQTMHRPFGDYALLPLVMTLLVIAWREINPASER